MAARVEVPENVASFAASAFGADGDAWARRVPDLVAALCRDWSLCPTETFPDLSINFVTGVKTADGTPAVLKICYPCSEVSTEIEALRFYDGRGSVRLLRDDESRGALLLQRVRPGSSLAEVDDDEAMARAFSSVVARLHRPPPAEHLFPTIDDWVLRMIRLVPTMVGPDRPFPLDWVDRAERIFLQLSAKPDESAEQHVASVAANPTASACPSPAGGTPEAEPVLLHGDLHQMNVLRSGDEWLAIDPKGVVGEPVWETGPLLLNCLPPDDETDRCRDVLAQRVTLLADALGIDRDRILAAGIVRAVLSAFWSLEDEGGNWGGAISDAERLSEIDATEGSTRGALVPAASERGRCG